MVSQYKFKMMVIENSIFYKYSKGKINGVWVNLNFSYQLLALAFWPA